MQDSVHMRLQVIGESVAKLSRDVRDKQPQIPWVKISDLRNLISHDYAKVDYAKVWRVVEQDLPVLKEAAQWLVKELEKS